MNLFGCGADRDVSSWVKMWLYWTSVLIKEEIWTQTCTQGKCHVRIKAEISTGSHEPEREAWVRLPRVFRRNPP